jgi:hypothetical protein
MSSPNPEDILPIANRIAEALSADILLLNAPFNPGEVDLTLLDLLDDRPLQKNVFVVLTSDGGDAAAAYRVARTLQRKYSKITIYVPGWCKSAGTLCALGAHEIVLGDRGELGPLDVQIRQKDELGERSSGLVVSESLNRLQQHSFEMFQRYMLEIKERSFGSISFKLAAEIAAKMTVGLLEPVYRQIDPVQIGDLGRAMTIASDYGRRLAVSSKNLQKDGIEALIQTYPSHDFVIDRREASEVFRNVREPSHDEVALAKCLGTLALFENPTSTVCFLSTFGTPDHDTQDDTTDESDIRAATARAAGAQSDQGNPGATKAT